jgi:hypothetical protein
LTSDPPKLHHPYGLQQLRLNASIGAVTTGTDWKFLKLTGQQAFIDISDYYIKEIDKILGILAVATQAQLLVV